MSAFAQQAASATVAEPTPESDWPGCEEAVLHGDGSMRWLGLLLLGGTSLVTLRAIYWVGDIILAHL